MLDNDDDWLYHMSITVIVVTETEIQKGLDYDYAKNDCKFNGRDDD